MLHAALPNGAQHHGESHSMARHTTALPHMALPGSVCLCANQKSEGEADISSLRVTCDISLSD